MELNLNRYKQSPMKRPSKQNLKPPIPLPISQYSETEEFTTEGEVNLTVDGRVLTTEV